MEELMFTPPIHQDIGSASMFRMYPTMMPGMGMYGAGMCYGTNIPGPGLTKDKFQLVNTKRQQSKLTAKKALLGTAATILSIAVLHKLPLRKGVQGINKVSKQVLDATKSVYGFIKGWVKWAGTKVFNLFKKIPSAPTP